jgi:hypothetical protein
MKKRNHLNVEYNEFKEFNEQREREEIYRTEKKDQHLGASKVKLLEFGDNINGFIYGICESGDMYSESGEPHVHLETSRGESEYYFTVNPITIKYKDGIKLSDTECVLLEKELNKKSKWLDVTKAYSLNDIWNCENRDNKKCSTN